MSDLDDKLKKILKSHVKRKAFSPKERIRFNIDIGIDEDTAVDQIKQAFADEGWVEERLNNEPRHTVKVMTGKEWLDRFEKELGGENLKAIAEHDVGLEREMLEAAKKASGVSDG